MDIVFFGAGASKEFGIPTTKEMVLEFRDWFRPVTSDDYRDKVLCDQIFARLQRHPDFDIEVLVTVLEHIKNPSKTILHLATHPCLWYFQVMGASQDLMTNSIMNQSKQEKEQASRLLNRVRDYIITKCSIHLSSNDERLSILDRFFTSVFGGGTRFGELRRLGMEHRGPLDLFSTNYDRIMEAYCGYCGWVWDNGEGGVRAGVPIARAGELDFAKLAQLKDGCKIYKLHGTINWYVDEDTERPMFAPGIPDVGKRDLYGSKVRENMLIFPMRDWYTFREPYYPLFHALKAKLLERRHCYVVGYSFRDEDILGLFLDAAGLNKNLTFCLVDPSAKVIAHTKLTKIQKRVAIVPYELKDERTSAMIQAYRSGH